MKIIVACAQNINTNPHKLITSKRHTFFIIIPFSISYVMNLVLKLTCMDGPHRQSYKYRDSNIPLYT